ncbi:MAG: CehA/McbA family metallohydrolase, partial [Candidatus Latescibacteria bacterium]|nr:CehA/McbA family metallohydrolase [Candidatus Latescibacterota bacterium]
IESLYPSNTDMFRLAEEQGAFRGYVHPYFGERDPNGGDEPTLGTAKAFPVDAALGTVEALEMSYASRAAYIVWHHMLNNDFKIIPVGGEDSISSLYRTAIVGQVRTYAYLGEAPLTWDNWISALRKGHTMVTNGPLPILTIDDRLPGDEIRLPAEGGTVTLTAEVKSIVPLDRAVIYRNGEIALNIPLKEGVTDGVFIQQIGVRESGWYTLHVESEEAAHPIDDGYPQASTNAIRVYVGDQPIRSPESARYFVRWIDRLMEMAEAHPGWRSDKERGSVMDQFMQARQVYEVLAR